MVEGVRAIRQVLDQGWPLESVLLSTARAQARPDLVRDARTAGAEVYGAVPALYDRIAGYHVHRGALALARRPAPRSVRSLAGRPGTLLVLEGVNDHENLGALFRNAAAFGVAGMVLDPRTADPLYRRAVRVSLGHVLRVPFARAVEWPEDLALLRTSDYRLLALHPAGERTLDEVVAAGAQAATRWAVVVGAEGPGLSAAALGAADVTVRIPLAPGVDSLNVATAAAVALSRLSAL